MSRTLQAQQHALTAYLRDPEHTPAPPDLDAAGLQVYRTLLFNNLQALLAGSFPVLLQVLAPTEWDALCRRYLVEHRCVTPLFTEVAREFVEWLQDQDTLPRPFLPELAHYEWVEQALQASPAEPRPAADADPWRDTLQVSPLAWPLAYDWPVQQLGRDHQPVQRPTTPTFLLARRVAGGAVIFAQLSALAWQLLEQINAGPDRTGADHLRALATHHGLPPHQLDTDGRALLLQMQAAGVIGAAA